MTSSRPRPQDRLLLREGALPAGEHVIASRSPALWMLLSLPLLGYFVWYHRAQCDCRRLLDDNSDPWLWMALLFPGMFLLVPYAIAQARIVARVELASRMPFSTVAYLALCVGGFFVPALLAVALQRRLNAAARVDPAQLRRMRIG